MSDVIQLLPDSVANQIAAGEVIQRPASVVKELMENAIDAGAANVHLIVKDAGKTLIQVVDDGKGMTDTDARLSFERHATSKITNAQDLFSIRTKGFRGEALASIAAIAHVDLKTRIPEGDLGTSIRIEGSKFQNQEPCQCSEGSSFSVKNLFYNVPARRNFLKSDSVEMRHIIDEFQRVALTHASIGFRMHHNDDEIFNLPAAPLRQRIVNVFGAKFNQRLVPVEVETDIVKIHGFIGKPEFARKTRGEQFLFVNDRFIRSSYLNHAVTNAFHGLLGLDSYPLYFLYLEIDPSEIDVNIHPTKTEIKFQDERSIYAIVSSSVKQALGKFNVAPTLDFEQETSIRIDPLPAGVAIKSPEVQVNPNYNPFKSTNAAGWKQPESSDWQQLFDIVRSDKQSIEQAGDEAANEPPKAVFQVHNKYLVTQIKSGIVVIDQQKAHERILFERNLEHLEGNAGSSQKLLFPQTVDMPASDLELLLGQEEQILAMGLEVEAFGKTTLKINGIPAESKSDPLMIVENLLHQLKHEADLTLEGRSKLAFAMARSTAIPSGMPLELAEMRHIIDQLFACEQPYYAPTGKPTVTTFSLEELEKNFE